MRRGGGAGQIVDFIYRPVREEGTDDVPVPVLESREGLQVAEVLPPAGGQVVQAQHAMAFLQQAQAKMAADKAETAGH